MAQTVDSMPKVLIMTTSPGYWGKGDTVVEAIENSKWIHGGDRVRVILVDEGAYVDEMGGLCYTHRRIIGEGIVRGVGKKRYVHGVIMPAQSN